MVLIGHLADTWGVQAHPETGTKTVWAEVSCTGADRITLP
jgi:hypothetical protein